MERSGIVAQHRGNPRSLEARALAFSMGSKRPSARCDTLPRADHGDCAGLGPRRRRRFTKHSVRSCPTKMGRSSRTSRTCLAGFFSAKICARRILPQLGPGVIAYVESATDDLGTVPSATVAPGASAPLRPFAKVLVVSLQNSGQPVQGPAPAAGGVSAAAALENALRTVLSFAALDEKRNNGRSQLATRSVAGANVTTLDSPISFAYAIDSAGSRIILGTSAEAVGATWKPHRTHELESVSGNFGQGRSRMQKHSCVST